MQVSGETSVSSVTHGLALLAEGVEELLAASAAPLDSAELLQALRGVEVAARKLPAVDHQLLAQCQEQGTAVQLGHRTLPELLRQMLRISAVQARARVKAAEVCGPRRALSGEVLPPIQPATAAAAHDGLIGVQHTRIISQVFGKIPTAVGPKVLAQAEASLASFATTMTPEELLAVGHRLLAHLDPDGQLTDDRDRARRRGLSVGRQGVDLMSPLTGTLTPACRAKLDAVFVKLAAPGAGTDHAGDPRPDVTDTRTPAQRNHDGLEALCDLVLGNPALGTHRGLPVTVVITMALTDLEHCTGYATTATETTARYYYYGHGGKRNTGRDLLPDLHGSGRDQRRRRPAT